MLALTPDIAFWFLVVAPIVVATLWLSRPRKSIYRVAFEQSKGK